MFYRVMYKKYGKPMTIYICDYSSGFSALRTYFREKRDPNTEFVRLTIIEKKDSISGK